MPPPDIVAPITETQVPTGKLSRNDMRLLRYGNLCNDFTKIAVSAAASDKTKEVAEKHMRALEKELADMKKAAADALKRKKAKASAGDGPSAGSGPGPQQQQESTSANVDMQVDPSEHMRQVARDPPSSTTKGRPEQKRKKGGLQLQPSRQTTCSLCKSKDHDARNCPDRLANPEKYPMFALFE